VEHLEKPASPGAMGNGTTAIRRRRLIRKDAATIAAALESLRGPYRNRGWFVFEGASYPDVYLETDSVIVVIEGKRTEPKPTISTKWMRTRHQMLRHIDAAWENRGERLVLGLLIVEGGSEEGTVPDPWREYALAISEASTIADSLPHRTPAERNEIAQAFLGATTWQRVCASFDLGWPPAIGKGFS